MAITKPTVYVPSFIKAALSGSRPVSLTWSDVSDTNILSTSSFQYDPVTSPLKSTQQINVDWSQFQNHTFFMSAEAKVNLAFDAIINGYPFDGTRRETEAFFERLSGFDRWVFDNFPRWRGALAFDSTQQSYVSVQNKTGALFSELSKNSAGRAVLNPTGSSSMTLEMQIFIPTVANNEQVVCQMLSGTTQGFSVNLLTTASLASVTAQFSVVSGSSFMTVPATLTKGVYNHVAFILNRDNGVPYLEAYVGSVPVAESRTRVEFNDIDIDGSQFLIGSGSAIVLGSSTLTPQSTLSGSIDEFRVFHSVRTARQQATYAAKSIFSTSDLVLYYRFNEPPPPIATTDSDVINGVVLDSSGNSLHALITNYTGSLRIDASSDVLNPVTYEHVDTTAVLFPAYTSTLEFNQELLASASLYDQENPNLITKLVPQHYLLEGAQRDGFEEVEGLGGQAYAGSGIPGQGEMGNVQIMVSLLYIWARFFDDIKLYVDSFSTLRTVDYETDETTPDNFLPDMVKALGFNLPPLFNDSTIEQYIRGENVDLQDITTNQHTLRDVQNTLLRRVMVNMPDVIRSKGTQHSIRSFLKAVGIDPHNNVRIREYGGPTVKQLSFSRESKFEPGTMVQFSTSSLVVSPFLSASRTEPGYPNVVGNSSDGLLTSGSWTYEGIVRYTPTNINLMQSSTQSLARLCLTGSLSGSSAGSTSIVANLIAISSSVDPRVILYIRPGDQSSSPTLQLTVSTPESGLFNYDKWNFSFGCQRGDDGLESPVSSSYFLRVAYQNAGQVEFISSTSSFFQENPTGGNVLRTLNSASNASGSFLSVGPNQLHQSGSGLQYLHLNDISRAPDEARATDFSGRMSNLRFWSRAVSESEWREHVRNYNSVGVEDPLVNWNYVTSRSGSFERLRMNSLTRQETLRANATASNGPLGKITFVDFSEAGFHLTGSGFPIESDCVVGEIFDLSYISPYFDEASTDEKIRVRSYQDQDLIDVTPWASAAPIHEIVASEKPTDDTRFTVEFSLIDALNRDIITMFATLDSIDNALGSPELVFAIDYPDLERMRDVYFNRIKEKLNFQAFFEFFRWFDTSIGTFIEQLVPRKTNFKGTNFTIESHMLERAKHQYRFVESYMGENSRQNISSAIMMQNLAGTVRKY